MRYSTSTLTRVRRAALVAVFASASVICWAATKGRDAGGYTGTDVTVYSFVDVSSSGAASVLADTDDGTAALTLPFAFQFYGQPYTLVCVSSNGAVYFVPNEAACNGLNDFANTDITSTQTPGNHPAVLPLWTDLTFQVAGAGAVFYQSQGAPGSRRFIIQWNNAYPQGSSNPVTFQAILSEVTNRILFQYKTVNLGQGDSNSRGGQATVGIRNAGAPANDQEIAWSYNAPVIADNSALLFAGADSTPPVTTAILTGALGTNGWRTGPTLVTLTAADADSSIAGTFYVLDGGAQTYSAPFTIAGDGTHQLSFYSRDSAGNQEAAHTQTVKIDATQPSLTAAANPGSLWPPNGRLVSVTVTGNVTDLTSGVDPQTGRFAVTDEYGQVHPSGSFSIDANGHYSFTVALVSSRNGNDMDGRKYTIAVRSKDMAGNQGSGSAVVTVPHDRGGN